MTLSTKRCGICKRTNDTVYWHVSEDTGDIWCWCNGCDRGYSLYTYCHEAGISLKDYLKGNFDFKTAAPNEVQKMDFPRWFVPLTDPMAAKGVEYIQSRGLEPRGDMYYDTQQEGIVFPYYFDNAFVGAQVRFIKDRITKDGDKWKITTMPSTRIGLLFYGWNSKQFFGNVKSVIVTEGAFNAIAIQQAFDTVYGGISKNPFRAIACSGSGATQHQRDKMKDIIDNGIGVIIAPDRDAAGEKMLTKFAADKALTHHAFPDGDDGKDWNDLVKEMGHEAFAKYFLSLVKKV